MSEQDNQTTPSNDAQPALAGNADDFAGQLQLEPENKNGEGSETKPAEDNAENPKSTGDKPAETGEPGTSEGEGGKPAEPEKPEEPKETEAERNRRYFEERQAQKRKAEQSINQHYQPQPVDELTQHFMEQGYDQFQAEVLARDEARNQREQLSEARAQVAELNMQIETEALQVMHEFPVFDPKSSDYDKAFADKASSLYQAAAKPVVDPKTGLVVQAAMTPYQFYKDLAEMRSNGMSKAEAVAQKAAEQQMASVGPATSSVPESRQSADDKHAQALSEAFDKV